MDVLAYVTHVVAFARTMPLTSTLLTRQSLPASAIVISLRPTVRTHCLKLSTILVLLFIVFLTSEERVVCLLSAIRMFETFTFPILLLIVSLTSEDRVFSLLSELQSCTHYVDPSQYPIR